MAKVILISGKICCGKTTYAEQLCKKYGAVLLSVDEIMLSLFDRELSEKHDVNTQKAKEYLFKKSLEIINNGVNVILDWGFWKKEDRDFARKYYEDRNIETELHYIDVSDEIWRARIEVRNDDVLSKKIDAYYVDDNLKNKFLSLFELPDEIEIDVLKKS